MSIATFLATSGRTEQDLLFQVVDPTSLWVEAFDYGDADPSALKHATAVGTGTKPMKLTFQGWSRTLQQQATVLQFSIGDPPASIRVGQPVTVMAEQRETVTGVVVSRDAVVRESVCRRADGHHPADGGSDRDPGPATPGRVAVGSGQAAV